MTARPGQRQSNFNAGELAPELWKRSDIKQFWSGAAAMRNVEPVPQGGFRLSARSRQLAGERTAIADIADQVFTLTAQPMAAAGVVATVTLPSVQPVAGVRLDGWSANQTVADGLIVEWQDEGGNWIALAPAFNVGPGERSRIAAAPPADPVMTGALRLRLVSNPPAAITFTFGAVTAFRETGTLAVDRVRPFTFSDTQTYVLVFTAGIADVYRDGVFVGAVRHHFADGDIEHFVEQQRFDTMLLFRDGVQTQRIMRQGGDHEWDWSLVDFDNIPEVDLGGTYTNVTDQWQIYLRWSGGPTDIILVVQVDGEDTAGIYHDGNWTNFANAMKAAIEDLAAVAPGITVTPAAGATSATMTVTFTGGVNEGASFVVTARVVNRTDAAATVAHTRIGKRGGEDLISETRGWPACGIFFQDRLAMGGFAAKKSAFLLSVTGEYFDLNTQLRNAAGAILHNLDTDGAERLQRFARGRHLLLFTSDAEYYVSDRAISRETPINVVECSRNGSAPTVPVLASENSLLYVAKKRSLVYSATYSDITQNYESEPISLLASHLVTMIRDAALQRATDEMDADRYYLVREDGVVVVGLFIRNQDVIAFVRWETDGKVRSMCVDGGNVVHLLVERIVDGAPRRFLERFEAGLLFDGCLTLELEPPGTIVGGLASLEGATVWAMADGYVEGPFVVSGGSINLPHASSVVTVGRWTPPQVVTLPLARDVAERIVLERPVRVHTVRLSLMDTTSIAIGANGQPPSNQPLYWAGDSVDTPPVPWTGELPVSGLVGWSEEGQVEITQTRPGRLQVRQVNIEAKR